MNVALERFAATAIPSEGGVIGSNSPASTSVGDVALDGFVLDRWRSGHVPGAARFEHISREGHLRVLHVGE